MTHRARLFTFGLITTLAFLPVDLFAETRIEAPGGVAAQSIENSSVYLGIPIKEYSDMVKFFSNQLTETAEARTKAEVRVAEISAQFNMTQSAVISFFRSVGEQDVPLEQIPFRLSEIAARYKILMEGLSALDLSDPNVAQSVELARAAISAGRYDEADALLLRARDHQISAAKQAEQVMHTARQAAERRWLRVAETEGTLGDLAMIRSRFDKAIVHYAAAAESVPANQSSKRRKYQYQEAFAFLRQGQEHNEEQAILMAVDCYRSLANTASRTTDPQDWAVSQGRLGFALQVLSERRSGIEYLEQAKTAHNAALEEFTRDRSPHDWAVTNRLLGDVFRRLGERTNRTAHLSMAVISYRAALEKTDRETMELDWAKIQSGLGEALRAIGERESGTSHLKEAIIAHYRAVEVLDRQVVPLDWATAQNSLGNTLRVLGSREKETTHLEEALKIHRTVLAEFPRERAPRAWATTQVYAGNALVALGQRESGTVHFEEAVAFYRASLEEKTREHGALDWAATQVKLGIALQALGDREAFTSHQEEAVEVFRAALDELKRSQAMSVWTSTQNVLGLVLWQLGERKNQLSLLNEAVDAWDDCLSVAVSIWPPDQVQRLRDRQNAVRSEIEERLQR